MRKEFRLFSLGKMDFHSLYKKNKIKLKKRIQKKINANITPQTAYLSGS